MSLATHTYNVGVSLEKRNVIMTHANPTPCDIHLFKDAWIHLFKDAWMICWIQVELPILSGTVVDAVLADVCEHLH